MMFRRKEIATPFDPVDYLKTPEDIAEYINAALEDGDPRLIQAAIGDVARAMGMAGVARDAGVTREALYRALSPEGNPLFTTVNSTLKAIGLKLIVAPA